MIELPVTRAQRLFLQSTTRGTIFQGGIGSGKTVILCRKAILKALAGRRCSIVSFSYPSLRDTVLFTMKEELMRFGLREYRDYFVNKNEMIVTVKGKKGPTEIMLRSPGSNPDSLRGPNLGDFLMDEGREFKNKKAWEVMLGRIRNYPDSQWYICTTTRGKNWVYHLGDQRRKEKVTVLHQTTYDSPFLPDEYIEDLEDNYTEQFAAQELMAEIVEFGAGVINPEWFIKVPYKKPIGGVRFWDPAVSIKTAADYSSGVRATFSHITGKFRVPNIIRVKLKYPNLRRKIIETAKLDGKDCIIGFEEAGQQQGFIDDLKAAPELVGYVIRARRPRGDKFNRLMPWASRAEQGKMEVCEGVWNKEFFSECNSFDPEGGHEHDDQIDGVSGAHAMLVRSGVATAARIPM